MSVGSKPSARTARDRPRLALVDSARPVPVGTGAVGSVARSATAQLQLPRCDGAV